MDGVPKAQVTEKDGEISCSIDETNRIRAALGMKPLRVGPSKDAEAVANFAHQRAEEAKVREQAAIRERIERARRKRQRQQAGAEQSLGESLMADQGQDLDDAQAWVERSRKRQRSAPDTTRARVTNGYGERARASARDLPAREPTATALSSASLSGLKVSHDLEAFHEGTDVVLTLKDTSVLNEDGNALADNDDELINTGMLEDDKRVLRERRKRRIAKGSHGYTGIDDEEFDDDGQPAQRGLLAQYDEEEQLSSAQITLDSSGGFNAAREKAIAVARAKLKSGSDSKRQVHSVALSNGAAGGKLQEYYTEDEMAKFRKPQKKKRKKKLRRKKRSEKGVADGDADKDQNDNQPTIVSVATLAAANATDDIVDDDDAELLQAMARARRLAQAKSKAGRGPAQREGGAGDTGAETVAAELNARAQGDSRGASAVIAAATAAMPSGVVFDSTTEFSRRMKMQRTDERESKKTANATGSSETQYAHGAHSAVAVAATVAAADGHTDAISSSTVEVAREKHAGAANSSSAQNSDTSAIVTAVGQQGEQDKGIGSGLSFGSQALVSGGMSAALALLRGTGDIRNASTGAGVNTSAADTQLAGRASDKRSGTAGDRGAVSSTAGDQFNVRLEYKDEFGREMTAKEAFRQMSYKFHGHAPGKKQQEKRLKILAQEIRAQKAASGDSTVGSMSALARAQQNKGVAHVVLQGGR